MTELPTEAAAIAKQRADEDQATLAGLLKAGRVSRKPVGTYLDDALGDDARRFSDRISRLASNRGRGMDTIRPRKAKRRRR